MKNFIFKSTTADLQKILQSTDAKLEVLNKNVLYVTYAVDKLVKFQKAHEMDVKLQKQVDDYFEDDSEDTAEHIPDKINEE